MAGKIFINYRRELAQGQALHLASILARKFGKSRIFFDIHGIKGFSDWLSMLKEQVAGSAAMISVIGPDWLEATDKDGNRRLDNPEDFVRFEIEEALSRGIPVLPVLLDGASLPTREQLPENMRGMLRWQAMDLQARRFDEDAQAIARELRAYLGTRRSVPVGLAASAAAIALAAGIYAGPYLLTQMGAEFPWVELRTDADLRRKLSEQQHYLDLANAGLKDALAKERDAKIELDNSRRWQQEAVNEKQRRRFAEHTLANAQSDIKTARDELAELKSNADTAHSRLATMRRKLSVALTRAELAEGARKAAQDEVTRMRLEQGRSHSPELEAGLATLRRKLGVALTRAELAEAKVIKLQKRYITVH